MGNEDLDQFIRRCFRELCVNRPDLRSTLERLARAYGFEKELREVLDEQHEDR